jgi:hypothetical protein
MTEAASTALRETLNYMDAMRRRSLWMTRFMLACSILALIGAYPILLFRGMTQLGVFICTTSVWALIAGIGINIGGGMYSQTTTILKAIEGLQQERPR